jgi:hypothetical protein
LSILIASTIAVPLELRIFQPEIENQTKENNNILLANKIKNDIEVQSIDEKIQLTREKINFGAKHLKDYKNGSILARIDPFSWERAERLLLKNQSNIGVL